MPEVLIEWKEQSPFLRHVPMLLCPKKVLCEEEFTISAAKKNEYASELQSLFVDNAIEEIHVTPHSIRLKLTGDEIDAAKQAFYMHILALRPQEGPLFIAPKLESLTDSRIEQLKQFIDLDVSPSLASHGGAVSIERIEDRKLYLKFHGGCQGCSQASMTLKEGIEKKLRMQFPEIKDIIDTTNHDLGQNPYFTGE